MQMTQARWNALSRPEKEKARDLSYLSPQLVPWKGWRVEVITTYGETRRFIVGQSTGWCPCSLEVSRRNSSGGIAADKNYQKVTPLYRVR